MINKAYIKQYADFLRKFLKPQKKLKVVFDCSNGSTGPVLKELLRKSGSMINYVIINQEPDGNFPAHGPDPLKEGAFDDLKEEIIRQGADLGVIFDADGDRVFFADGKGNKIDSGISASLIGKDYSGSVLLDASSGYYAHELIKNKIIESRVGHFFIKKEMRKRRLSFAAERSGHYYFKDFFFADSGIFAAIKMINAVSEMEDFQKWLGGLPKFYTSGEVNFEVEDKKDIIIKIEKAYKRRAKKISKIDGLKMSFKDFWFIVRGSNTENVVRLVIEARKKSVLNREFKKIQKMLTL